jgi:D-cysteine desulfhydrase family pyridoxal phosphate-dependent enzyme
VIPPKVELIQALTPLHRLRRASEKLGLELWIKRDDLTGFAMGGNKGRKLEYLIADALDQKAEVVVSCGALQSNFVRQLGAACACFGLECACAVMQLPFPKETGRPSVKPMRSEGGNVLLDQLVGIHLRVHPDGTWEELDEHTEALAREYEALGRRVYRIPIGGSTWLGAYAFEQAGLELQMQLETGTLFDWIVFASSSGSTQTGLARVFAGTQTRVLGIACDPESEMPHDFAALAEDLRQRTGGPQLAAEDFLFNLDFVGPAYGVPSQAGNAAIVFLARTEGIFLDPIYSGKAFAGLMELAKTGEISGTVLFWHTGGTPALFAMP